MDNDDSRIRRQTVPSLIGRGNIYDIIVAMATMLTSTSILCPSLIGRGEFAGTVPVADCRGNLYDIIVAMLCPSLIGRGPGIYIMVDHLVKAVDNTMGIEETQSECSIQDIMFKEQLALESEVQELQQKRVLIRVPAEERGFLSLKGGSPSLVVLSLAPEKTPLPLTKGKEAVIEVAVRMSGLQDGQEQEDSGPASAAAAVPSSSSDEEFDFHKYLDDMEQAQRYCRFPDLYFKVQKIDGEHGSDGYVADSIHSTLYQVECAKLCRDSSASSIARLHSVFSRAQDCGACVLLLCHLDLLGKDRDGSGEDTRVISALCSLLHGTSHSKLELPFLVVATTSRAQEVPLDLQSCFLHEVCLNIPTEEQRLSLLTVLTAPLPLSRDVDLARLASSTAGFVVGDLCALLARAGRISCTRIRSSCVLSEEEEDGLLAAGFFWLLRTWLTPPFLSPVTSAVFCLKEEVPRVHWADVGDWKDAKRQLLDTVQLPLEHPEMLSLGLRRSGILLYGPPGTGKTLLAKAVATECAMTFLSVTNPDTQCKDCVNFSTSIWFILPTPVTCHRPDLCSVRLIVVLWTDCPTSVLPPVVTEHNPDHRYQCNQYKGTDLTLSVVTEHNPDHRYQCNQYNGTDLILSVVTEHNPDHRYQCNQYNGTDLTLSIVTEHNPDHRYQCNQYNGTDLILSVVTEHNPDHRYQCNQYNGTDLILSVVTEHNPDHRHQCNQYNGTDLTLR
ncbi:unnamed protein product [Ranitomeya imitator]|uniref:ATPase AAA-type core domain-containing protein n=1 Tax=Ranitomeya imitator TaxID=111125 RepID=A0ABN9M548_9NEOB|nr:unnamed protein product [Ranitomeya imitator]